jgi:hypothetical protein
MYFLIRFQIKPNSCITSDDRLAQPDVSTYVMKNVAYNDKKMNQYFFSSCILDLLILQCFQKHQILLVFTTVSIFHKFANKTIIVTVRYIWSEKKYKP